MHSFVTFFDWNLFSSYQLDLVRRHVALLVSANENTI